MKKIFTLKPFLLIMLLLMTLALLVGCDSEGDTPPSDADTNSSQNIEGSDSTEGTTEAKDPKEGQIILSEDLATEYKIISYYQSSDSVIENFRSQLKSRIGVQPKLSYNTENISGKQIVLASYADVEGVEGLPSYKSWTGISIWVKGETIYVLSANKDTLADSCNVFIEKIKTLDSKLYGIKSDTQYTTDLCDIEESVPEFTPTRGKLHSVYDCGGGNWQATFQNITNVSDVTKYAQTLIDAGYEIHQTNTINSNTFTTYTKGDTMVHVNWYPSMNSMRVVYGPKGYLPSKTPITNYETKATPTISQMKLSDTGLSMVLQLVDGSFVIIDSGRDITGDYSVLYDFLIDNAPAGEKPQVTWIFTHAHSDHIGMATKFIPQHKNDIDVNLVAWNMPEFSKITLTGDEEGTDFVKPFNNLKNAITSSYPDCQIYTFHAGQKLYLPECEIEIYLTQEDFYPTAFGSLNDTSCAFKVKMGGKTMMVFGDTDTKVNTQIASCFGSTLKSDIMQVPHHGANGGTLPLYKAVDPDICIWSVSQTKFETDGRMLGTLSNYSFNAWLRRNTGSDGERARSHYHQSVVTVIKVSDLSVTTY